MLPSISRSRRSALLGALWCGVFSIVASTGVHADILISEIHYAPVDASGVPQPNLEFVEVFNDGPEVYDLTGYQFVDGFSFEFTERTFIPGRGYIVICRDEDALRDAYGITNTVGNFDGILDNSGERLSLANPQGAIVSSVSYNDRGKWPAAAKGTGHSLALFDGYTDPGEPENWRASTQFGGTPGRINFATDVTFEDRTLIEPGEEWRYRKGTSAPPASWASRTFDDGSWSRGETGIGYGDGDDATVLDDMEDNYLTVFCRKSFALSADDIEAIDDLVLRVVVDDGIYVYLNGASAGSSNGTGRGHDDNAGSAGEPETVEFDLTGLKDELVVGTNVVAASVHNANLGSSDLSFIPSLLSRRRIEPEETATVPVIINEGLLRSAERFVELHNTSGGTIDLAGYFLTDDFADLERYSLPAGTTIGPRGFLQLTEAETGLDFSVDPGLKDRVSIALTNPNGTRVVDAYIFEPKVDGKSEARVPDGIGDFEPAAVPTPGAANEVDVISSVVFNEIMYHTISDDVRGEYIEFFNRGDVDVDLGGWRVVGVDYEFPPGTVIPAGDYRVIAHSPSRIRQVYDLDETVVLEPAWGGRLRDSGERIDLVDLNGNTADSVRFYDGGEWPVWTDGLGSSLELIDPFADNENPLAWDASDDSAKARATTIQYGGVPFGGRESDFGVFLAEEGIAIIDDVSLQRSGSNTNLIRNPSFDSSTTSWRIEGTHSRSGRTSDDEETLRGGGSLKLICWGGGGDYKVNRVEQNTSTQTSGSYSVSFEARWVVGSPRIITIGDYSTGQPSNPGLAGSNRLTVPSQLGTPGAVNSVTLRQIDRAGSSNIGPTFGDAHHSPGVPSSGAAVTVSARVRDPDGVVSVSAYYRAESPNGSFTEVRLSHEGGGLYRGTIPGMSQGTKVLFYFEAVDTRGGLSRFPRDIARSTHPPIVDPDSPSRNDLRYLLYRHDRASVSTSRHALRFILNEASESELGSRRVLSNQMLDGTLVFGDDDIYYNAKIRFAGSPWLRPGGGFDKSYALRFPKDNPLHGRHRAINLDEHGSNARERISHYLLRHSAGKFTKLPYWDFHALSSFELNDVHSDTKEILAKPNSQYLNFWFPDDDVSPFYEMDDRFQFDDSGNRQGNAEAHVLYPPYGSSSGGDNKENYRWYFVPRGNTKSYDEFGPLIALAQFMDDRRTPNATFDAAVFDLIDVEELLRVFAIELNIDDWDTWSGRRGKNGYLHQSSSDGLWRKIPWDLELTYGDVNATSLPSSPTSTYRNHFREIERFINRPAIKRRYYGILAEQVDTSNGFFHSRYLGPYMQRLQADSVSSTGIGTSGGFIDQRATRIRGWIRTVSSASVDFEITTNDGNDFVSENDTVRFSGTAPVEVAHLVVHRNGDPIDVQTVFASMTRWQTGNMELGGDVNEFEILGFNSQGEFFDSATIRVTAPFSFEKPEIISVTPERVVVGGTIEIRGTNFHPGLEVRFNGFIVAENVEFDPDVDPSVVRVVLPEAGLTAGVATVAVKNIDGKETDHVVIQIIEDLGEIVFIRGDANLDGGANVSDALAVLNHLFSDGFEPGCLDAADVNDSGVVDISDPVNLLNFLFGDEAPPLPPYPDPGTDPTPDETSCLEGL